ncbi:MAG: 2-phospho-L-lactate guanylyltransferase [Actinomycetota bacterium]|nr:2-phospho-L-lactate guanylyltransferase [Actinomycetota bacterium]
MSSEGDRWRGRSAVLVPVKAFHRAKLRLAPALSPERRRDLARSMATQVVRSAAGLPVAVVCDDEEVATWARSLGALVVWEPGRGLNQAVQEGFAHLGRLGVHAVIVAAGDLPQATDLRWVSDYPGITIVPDRRRDGTNVIGLPGDAPFTFSYGPGSFARHVQEAHAAGVPVRVVHSAPLGWDVDVPEDLVGVPGA